MMRQYELVERVKSYQPAADEGLLNRAYVYAMKAHGAQKRASGDPYFSHPLEVAAILTELRLDESTIVAALLHDTIEDTDATRGEIEGLFGHRIAALVEGLTKLKRLDLVSKEAAQAENLRKLLLAIAEDVRVLLVKLADRLHNMRTLHFVGADKRSRIARETLDIYGPLAGRMGMQEMREELEALSFRELFPEAFAAVRSRLDELETKNAGIIEQIGRELRLKLSESQVEAEVTGRAKRAYSIWQKMERKSVGFEQLSDVYGFRVIVRDVGDCYRALGVVHTTWPLVPGRFKDYISVPKQNDYQSLHTTVMGPGHQRVELQIRTREMDEVAEYGIAAHAFYKDRLDDGREALERDSKAYQWLRRTIAQLAEGDTPEEFLEHTKLELFHDQVFCFTPKGRLIALPHGATPIDFAYAVHTDVGNSCVGCKVNGRIAPLISPLHNGDQVEIIRSENHVPPAAWDSLVVTGKARSSIRRATRAAVRAQYTGLGRQIVERAFQRSGEPFSEERLKAALPRLARSAVDDVFAAVGRGEMRTNDVLHAIHPEAREKPAVPPLQPADGWFGMQRGSSLQFRVPGPEKGVPVRGLRGDLPVRFAPNGGAVPGDRIVGILQPGREITIYPIQSPDLQKYDDRLDRWLDVRWDVDPDRRERFPARIKVTAINEPGTLAEIATVIGKHEANIDDVDMTTRSPDFQEIIFDLSVFNLKYLTAILNDLRSKPVVSSAERVNG